MSNSLTLFIPELLNAPAGLAAFPESELPRLPALLRLLSRAELKQNELSGYYPELMRCFGLKETATDFPGGALTYFMQSGERDQNWRLRIDPVYVQSDLSTIHLLAHEAINLQQDEAAALVESLNEHFQQDGWQITVATSHCWYLTAPQKTRLSTTPLYQAMGENMNAWLPVGDDAGYWHSVLNEIQMLLHQHPVNQVRQEKGQVSVNSVWLWGSGVLPESVVNDNFQLYTDELIAQGLAMLSSTTSGSLDEIKKKLSHGDFSSTENDLIIDDRLLVRQYGFDINRWFDALLSLEQEWFVPLLKALQQKNIDQLEIITGDGRRFGLNRKLLRRWWRRDRNLHHWCESNK